LPLASFKGKTVLVANTASFCGYTRPAEELGAAATPRWNFHKYLIGPDGRLAAWFPTATEPTAPEVPEAIEANIASP